MSATARTDAAPAVLVARAVSKRYGARSALTDVSFAIAPGELVALVGANGAGKTTLLSILAGVTAADTGELSSSGTRPGWVPQQPAVYSKLSVAENLRLFARLERVPDPEAAVERMLEQIDLPDRRDTPVGRLSGGSRQRVNIALGLISDPAVLLLDEPSASLDVSQRERMWQFVGNLAARGTAILYSTHNLAEVERHADRVLLLDGGEMRFSGTPLELTQQGDGDARDLESAFVNFLSGSDD